jgi:Resolvase, N terminal domain
MPLREPRPQSCATQNTRCCGVSAARFQRGFNWDRLPSTAAFRPTTSHVIAKNVTSGRSLSAPATRSLPCSRTASGAKDDRPHRKKVMALAQAREIDAILVTELSRWAEAPRTSSRRKRTNFDLPRPTRFRLTEVDSSGDA